MKRRQFLETNIAAIAGASMMGSIRPGIADDAPMPGPCNASGVGINLTGLTDWNRENPFLDPFRLSRSWISQAVGARFGQGPPLDLDENGWIRRLEPNCWAETLMFTNQKDHIPEGRYRIEFKGKGRIDTGLNARFVGQMGNEAFFDVARIGEGVALRIRETDPTDPVRDIRIALPGKTVVDPEAPFRKEFLDLWRGMGVIRFMDWMATNDSTQVTWNDRPKLTDSTWTVKGAPLEVIVQLANRLRTDAWVCVPHMADNGYVQNMASLIEERLDKDLRVWVELSNETWNGIFKQSRYFRDLGKANGVTGKSDYQIQLETYSARSVQVFKIFDEAFGDQKNRVVRVLSAQSVNQWTSETVLSYQDAFRNADTLAIAPYFGNEFGDPKTVETVENMEIEDFMASVAESAKNSMQSVTASLQVARKYGLPLTAYEAGQHLVGRSGTENREKLTKLFHAANRHPAMHSIYQTYLNDWKKAGAGPIALFASVSEYTKWGSWGLKEWPNDPIQRSPKFSGTQQFQSTTNRWWNVGRTS